MQQPTAELVLVEVEGIAVVDRINRMDRIRSMLLGCGSQIAGHFGLHPERRNSIGGCQMDDEVSRRVIGAAFTVHNFLRPCQFLGQRLPRSGFANGMTKKSKTAAKP
jgi:hypothetical protein